MPLGVLADTNHAHLVTDHFVGNPPRVPVGQPPLVLSPRLELSKVIVPAPAVELASPIGRRRVPSPPLPRAVRAVNVAGAVRASGRSTPGRAACGALRTGQVNTLRARERAGCGKGPRASRRPRGAGGRCDLTGTLGGDHEKTLQSRVVVDRVGVAPRQRVAARRPARRLSSCPRRGCRPTSTRSVQERSCLHGPGRYTRPRLALTATAGRRAPASPGRPGWCPGPPPSSRTPAPR